MARKLRPLVGGAAENPEVLEAVAEQRERNRHPITGAQLPFRGSLVQPPVRVYWVDHGLDFLDVSADDPIWKDAPPWV